jgi:hypothetical protein
MKKVNLKPQLATITTISMVAVLSAIILSQSTVLPTHNAYAKDKSTQDNKDCSQSDTSQSDSGKVDNTKDCSTTTDNQEKEDKDNGKDKSNDD